MDSQVMELRAELIKSKIEDALVRLAHEQAKLISIKADGKEVTIGGTVTSNTAERAVVVAASRVPGVGEVKDALHVVPYLPDDTDPDRPWR